MRIDLAARLFCFAALVGLGACSMVFGERSTPPEVPGDARRGAASIAHYGCGSCHVIAGISAAHGLVGPPLSGIGSRMYVAGMLKNTPDNLAQWVEHPTAINQKTVMPDLGVSHADAVDIAAYLNSLK